MCTQNTKQMMKSGWWRWKFKNRFSVQPDEICIPYCAREGKFLEKMVWIVHTVSKCLWGPHLPSMCVSSLNFLTVLVEQLFLFVRGPREPRTTGWRLRDLRCARYRASAPPVEQPLTLVPLVYHGAQCRSVVHNIVLYRWGSTQRRSHKPIMANRLLCRRACRRRDADTRYSVSIGYIPFRDRPSLSSFSLMILSIITPLPPPSLPLQ